MTRRLDIEGQRAIAVMSVLLYHLRVPGLGGGFAGVDIFFVVSGFLITTLLLREIESSGRIALPTFLAKRARRLLPAALLVTAATLVAGLLILPGHRITDLVQDSIGSSLYVVNWVLAGRSVDYLSEDAGVSPLQHYWSLSIEEQFYFGWPLLLLTVVLIAARFGWSWRRLAVLTVAALAAGSLYLSITTDSATTYFATHHRAWEILAGVLLALVLPRLVMPRATREALTAVGLLAILFSVLVFDSGTAWPGWAAVVPVLGTAAVIAGGSGTDTSVSRILSLRPLVWIGGLSYSLYLWHWPLLVLSESRFGTLDAPALVIIGLLSIALAWVTKHVIEDPIRKAQLPTARTLVAAGTGMAVVVTASVAVLSTRPTLDDLPTPELASMEVTTAGPLTPPPDLAPEDVPAIYPDGCQITQGTDTPRFDCIYGDLDSPTDVVLWGDSKLGQWHSAFEEIATDRGWKLTVHTKSACPPTTTGAEPDCNTHGRAVLDHLLDDPPALVIIGTGASHTPELEAGVTEVFDELAGAGIAIVVLADNPYPPGSQYPCAAEHPDDLAQCTFEATPGMGNWLADLATIPVLDMSGWVCADLANCPVAVDGILIWRQGSHVTNTFAHALTEQLGDELDEIAAPAQ